MIVDGDDLDFDRIANLEVVSNLRDEAVIKFADVQQTISARHDFDKRTVVGKGRYFAYVDLADLHIFSDASMRLRASSVPLRSGPTIVTVPSSSMLTWCRSLPASAADVFATRADDHADLFLVDLDLHETRCVIADVALWCCNVFSM